MKRWRFYCDFCKRAGGSGGTIAKHETGCTKNPLRVCGMCKLENKPQAPIAELIAALGVSLDALRTLCADCPACILAAIRQSDEESYKHEWSYNEAAKTWWEEHNERERVREQWEEYNSMMAEEMRGL